MDETEKEISKNLEAAVRSLELAVKASYTRGKMSFSRLGYSLNMKRQDLVAILDRLNPTWNKKETNV